MRVLEKDFSSSRWYRTPGMVSVLPQELNADKTEWTRNSNNVPGDAYALRYTIERAGGHRIIVSADMLTDDLRAAMIYFRIFDKDGNRIDDASANQQSKAKITGQYHRVSCSLDCTHPDIGIVHVALGSLFSNAGDGNVKIRNPTIQIESIAGQKSEIPEDVENKVTRNADSGVIVNRQTGFFKSWRTVDIDLSLRSQNISDLHVPSAASIISSGFSVGDEGSLLADAEHISSIFIRSRIVARERWTFQNSNPRPTSRVIPMYFWAEGFID